MITFCKLSDKLKNFFSSIEQTVVKRVEAITVNLASNSSLKYMDCSAFFSLCSIVRKLLPPKKFPFLNYSNTTWSLYSSQSPITFFFPYTNYLFESNYCYFEQQNVWWIEQFFQRYFFWDLLFMAWAWLEAEKEEDGSIFVLKFLGFYSMFRCFIDLRSRDIQTI